jgi:acetate kinase
VRVLALNCGSSSLKCALFDFVDGRIHGEPTRGGVQSIAGGEASAPALRVIMPGRRLLEAEIPAGDHAAAALELLRVLDRAGCLDEVDVVGHRVVHGGPDLVAPAMVDSAILRAIDDASALAPLHNPAAAAVIDAVSAFLPRTPAAVTFDTAFHAQIPEHAARYPISSALADPRFVRRFGFHGLAHRSMVASFAGLTGKDAADARLITLQLGAGCSAAAVKWGRSIDTSMGFTPLEGLMMGTRCGDVDASIVPYVSQRLGVDAAEAVRQLNSDAGLLGVSERSSDLRALRDLAADDERAALAIDMFCYRVRKYVGSYLAVLGGADGVVFGGAAGIGAPWLRASICEGMEWCGVALDPSRNAELTTGEGLVHRAGAGIAVAATTVDEELLVARDAASCAGAPTTGVGAGYA